MIKTFSHKTSSAWYLEILKAGLHRNANTNAACENDAYVHVGKFVNCSAFAEAANWPYINVLYANSLWCTDSRRIAFGCLPNVCHTAECCLPRLRIMSTSNVCIVFACRVCVLFAFRCKHGFRCWKIRNVQIVACVLNVAHFKPIITLKGLLKVYNLLYKVELLFFEAASRYFCSWNYR